MSKSIQFKSDNDNPFLDSSIEVGASLNDTTSKKTVEEIKNLHQYYRDCLVNSFEFPPLGSIPLDLVKLANNSSNTDTVELVDQMHSLSNEGLSPEHDLALRLMLLTIVQTHLTVDKNNRFIDYTPHPKFLINIKKAINRVLQLHNHE